MNIFALSGLLTVMTGLPIAAFVYWAGSDRVSDRIWAFFVLAVSGFGFATYKIALLQDAAAALIWWRISMFFVILIPVFFYHYIQHFLDVKNRIGLFFIYASGFFFLIFNFTDYFVRDMKFVFGSFYYNTNPTPLYTAFVLWLLGIVFYSHYRLWKIYGRSSGEKKNQIAYFFLATAVGFSGGVTSFLPIFGTNFYPFLNLTVPLYPIIMTYAILRHHLFGIKVFATGLLTGVILLVLLFQIFFSQTLSEFILRTLFFLIIFWFGILLIRSVLLEIRTREEIERLAKNLEEANAELKKFDAAKSEFISLAGHQLRAPLTVIKGYTSMLQEGSFGELNKKAVEALNRVLLSINNLIKLVSELLDLSRIEAGQLKYDFKKMFLDDVIDDAIKELAEISKEKRIDVQFKNENNKTFSVFGDPAKLYEVVINLLDNALKYSKIGSVVVTLRPRSKRLALSVADNGIGIQKDDISKLFQKFGRTEMTKKDQPDGMGLGLYFAKRIVDDHSGRIWVESEGVGKGSTFFVELPVA